MEIDGRLRAQPNQAVVAGDRRANENIGLTAVQNLFAREHNRIVGLLNARTTPRLTEEQKFQIARRVVIAEQQFITYNEFLPAFGVRLAPYRGYNPRVNTSLSNEFATVGYRAHSQIHGEFELEVAADRYSAAQLAQFEAQGIEVIRSEDGAEIELAIPLNVAFFNPNLLKQLVGACTAGLRPRSAVQQRRDDRQPAPQRAVPDPGRRQPRCLDGPGLAECFRGVVDLGAIDIERGATTACRRTTTCAGRTASPVRSFRRSPARRPTRSRPTELTRTARRPRQPRLHRAGRRRRQPDRSGQR